MSKNHAGKVKAAVPNLPSLNLDRTVDFYTAKLGMHVVGRYDDYVIMARDSAEVHFWSCGEPAIPKASSCYLRVQDIRALYAEFTERGVTFQMPLKEQPWGVMEFMLADPDGNNVRAGEDL